MNLFILGATGGTGSEVVGQALARGHQVTAFVRSPEKIAHRHDRLRVVTGDPRQADRLGLTLEGHDAILSALGPRSLGHTTLLADCARSALAAMGAARLRRLLVVSSGLLFPDAELVAALLRRFIFFNVVRDSREMETVVAASDLDWTIVRPPRLTRGPHTGRFRFQKDHLPPRGRSISRADLAHFLLDAITNDDLHRAIVGVSAWGVKNGNSPRVKAENLLRRLLGRMLRSRDPDERDGWQRVSAAERVNLPPAEVGPFYPAFSTAPRRWSQRATSQHTTAHARPADQPASTSVG